MPAAIPTQAAIRGWQPQAGPRRTALVLWTGMLFTVSLLIVVGALVAQRCWRLEQIARVELAAIRSRAATLRDLERLLDEYGESAAVPDRQVATRRIAEDIDVLVAGLSGQVAAGRQQEFAAAVATDWRALAAAGEALGADSPSRDEWANSFRERRDTLHARLAGVLGAELDSNLQDAQSAITRDSRTILWISAARSVVLATVGAYLLGRVFRKTLARQQRLTAREEQFLASQQAAAIGTWDWDLQTGTVSWTDQTWRTFGQAPGAFPLSFQSWLACVHVDDRAAAVAAIESAKVGGEYLCEYRVIGADGGVRWIESRGQFHYDAERRPIRMIGKVQEISARKEAEAAIHKANDELERRVCERTASLHAAHERTSVLADCIAHELNQPLAAIANYARGCSLRLGPEAVTDVQHALQRIAAEAHRAGDLIGRLRELTGRRSADRQPASLTEAVADALRILPELEAPGRVRVIRRLPASLPAARIDRALITQVVVNLVHNALEAMSELAPERRELLVEVRDSGEGLLQVDVLDNGTGLPPAVVEQLFTPFRSTKPGGMGLGLVISREIIERHDGRLWGEPRESGGAAFHFQIPVASTEDPG